MTSKYMRYWHHNENVPVWVQKDMKGRHREFCLCHKCEHFKPPIRIVNCEIANKLFAMCVEFDVVTPVWECPFFRCKNISEMDETLSTDAS